MKFIRIFIGLISILVFVQCQNNLDLGTTEYDHLITEISVDCSTDTISVGDTIWFESTANGFLKDSATRNNVYFLNALLNIKIQVRSWNKENQDSIYDFCNFEVPGYSNFIASTEKSKMIGLYYTSNGSNNTLKFGVVFNTPGVYSIDSDYLKFKNYFSDSDEYYGGGIIQYEDIQNNYQEAYIIAEMSTDNRNLHLYEGLSESDKESFQVVDEKNQNKYFFIKVID